MLFIYVDTDDEQNDRLVEFFDMKKGDVSKIIAVILLRIFLFKLAKASVSTSLIDLLYVCRELVLGLLRWKMI